MAWAYQQFAATEANDDLWQQVQNALDALPANPSVLCSVKVGSLNSLTYDARTAIFYDTGLTEIPDPKTLGGSWSYQSWAQETDYDALFQSVVDMLNDPNKLTDTQKFWARVSISDRNSAAATATLWWRNQN